MATSTPTPTTSVIATATSLLALTTPFVTTNTDCRPGHDTSWFQTSSWTSSYVGGSYSSTMYAYWIEAVMSNTAAACQIPGWDQIVPSRRFSYSPAVCPSGWLAHRIGSAWTSPLFESTSKILTTAICCEPGYGLYQYYGTGFPFPNYNPACVSTSTTSASSVVTRTKSELTTSVPSIATITDSELNVAQETITVHPGWHITWEAKDQSILTPEPPTLTNSMFILLWTPGSVIEDGKYDNGGSGPYKNDSTLRGGDKVIALSVSLPVLFIALCCAGCCCFSSRDKKKRRLKATSRAADYPLERVQGAIDRAVFSPNGAAGDIPSRDSLDGLGRLPPAYVAPMEDAPPAYTENNPGSRETHTDLGGRVS